MTKSNQYLFGKEGEALAAELLIQKGYRILATNYQNKMGELDIIAQNGELLVIVEVKRRKSSAFGYPREAVSYGKQRQIVRMAQSYIQRYRLHQYQVRFDVIEIIGDEILHIEDAFRVS